MKATIYISLLLLIACQVTDKKAKDIKPYKGPVQVADDVELLYSESAILKIKLIAKKQIEYPNGDREFPEGLYMEFYDEKGIITSTMKADEVFYFKDDNKYRGRGDVEVINTEKKQQLNTEELFWTPGDEKIFTDKFVTIKLQDEVLYGNGLISNQDFSEYEITNPQGTFLLEDE